MKRPLRNWIHKGCLPFLRPECLMRSHRFAAWPRFALRLFFSACVFLSGCSPQHQPVPPGVIPQPKPLSLTDEQYGHQVLNELSDKYTLDYNHPRTAEVEEIVQRLTRAAHADKDPWHVYIFRDHTVKNAAATRGNHVFIWSGLLDATTDEAEVATILAHEVSHVIAGHTEPDPHEEIKKILVSVGAAAAGIAASAATGSSQLGNTVGQLAQGVTEELGSSVLLYPFSRELELEADQVGLFLMAEAHYDPQAAIRFWTKAQSDPDFSSSLGFLSTHPPAERRLEALKRLLPEAEARYYGQASSSSPGIATRSKQSASSPSSSSSIPDPKISDSRIKTAPVPAEDTFAVDDATRHSIQGKYLQSFQVGEHAAVLFQTPSPKAKKLGEFRSGTVISGQKNGRWVEIYSPEHGFLYEGDLRLERN